MNRLRSEPGHRRVRRHRHRGLRSSIHVRRRLSGFQSRAGGPRRRHRRQATAGSRTAAGRTDQAGPHPEQEGSDPAATWQQAGQIAAPDLYRALLQKEYGISETAPAARPWRDAATMGAAFGAAALAPIVPMTVGVDHPAAPAAAGILPALGLGKAWILNRRQTLRQSLEITAVGTASAAGVCWSATAVACSKESRPEVGP